MSCIIKPICSALLLTTMARKLLVIVNPACGDRAAPAFVDAHVRPLLDEHAVEHTVVHTEREGHAGELSAHFLRDAPLDSAFLVASGDGTVHEIVNALSLSPAAAVLSLVLVPCGTGNALYSSFFPPDSTQPTDTTAHKLLSLKSYLNRTAPPRPLTLARTTFHADSLSASPPITSIISAVVTSTSLHASILHDSETLRAAHPGLERFKMAAEQNIANLYYARVQLLPIPAPTPPELSSSDAVPPLQLYDPTSDKFVPHPSLAPDNPGAHAALGGPFAYFLSTVNVDRLEPAFRITPLAASHAPPPSSMDLLIIRPPSSAEPQAVAALNMQVS